MPQFPEADSRNPLADDCRRCPELVEHRECISWGNGPLDAALVVVGEAPGAGDPDADRWRGGNWTSMAYTSRHSGRRIRELLTDVGYDQDDCYFTNAVKCFPADGEGSNREPTSQERANCQPYLREEIEAVAPEAIVTTGKHATKSVLAMADRTLDGFLDSVLEPTHLPEFDTALVPVLHPSYQDIWIQRIGHTPDSYQAELRRVLDGETVY